MLAGVKDGEFQEGEERGEEFRQFYMQECVREGWKERVRAVGFDGRCEGP